MYAKLAALLLSRRHRAAARREAALIAAAPNVLLFPAPLRRGGAPRACTHVTRLTQF